MVVTSILDALLITLAYICFEFPLNRSHLTKWEQFFFQPSIYCLDDQDSKADYWSHGRQELNSLGLRREHLESIDEGLIQRTKDFCLDELYNVLFPRISYLENWFDICPGKESICTLLEHLPGSADAMADVTRCCNCCWASWYEEVMRGDAAIPRWNRFVSRLEDGSSKFNKDQSFLS